MTMKLGQRKMRMQARLVVSVALLPGAHVAAQDESSDESTGSEPMEEIVVWGRASQLLGAADAASQGVVGYADFSTRPLLRVGELVEVVPGMIATQHSGPGKANQYFLRGINLDHGSDFAARFDGMPINFRTHAHAQGYLDLNFIIPEVVERVEYRKGPYYADSGDFSLAGSISFKTYDRLERPFSELVLGSENDYRLVAAGSHDLADGTLLYAGELAARDGPWELEQDLDKLNGLIKYSGRIGDLETQITASAYTSEWVSTDQIPQRAVESGQLTRFGFIDPAIGGESTRLSVAATLYMGATELVVYGSRYELNLLSNPTYFLNDPINGDEIEQEDRRSILGAIARRDWDTSWGNRLVFPTVGAELRYDKVDELNLFNTVARQRVGSVREDEAQELSVGIFAEAEILLTDKLRSTIGLRGDFYDFDVTSKIPANSGGGSESLVQPKLGLAYEIANGMEIYANYGTGFHSNDVRGVTIRVDPVSGDPATPVETLVEGEGYEFGYRSEAWEGLKFSVVAFWLDLDSELLFIGDAGTTEPSGATRRHGIELSAFWEASDRLVVDLTAAKTHGRYKDAPAGENRIPDAHEFVLGAGATWVLPRLTASFRVRHFSDAPLTETGSVSKGDSTLANLGISYDFGKVEVGVDVLNLFDAEDDDIAYFFESRLIDEPAPMEDIHFHPVESRAVRASARWRF
jgi:outer membrane receptor protein involved in Fe transport